MTEKPVDLAEQGQAQIAEASVALITAIALAVMARPEGLIITAIDKLAAPIIVDNANAIFYFIPKLKRDFGATDLGNLIMDMAESPHLVEATDPLLSGEKSTALFRDSRNLRTRAYELLDQYLENAVELARSKSEAP